MSPNVTINQPIGGLSSMPNAEDIKDIAFQNHTAAMSALTNGVATTTNLLDKVAIKKFDEVGAIEAKGVQTVAWSPPVSGAPQG